MKRYTNTHGNTFVVANEAAEAAFDTHIVQDLDAFAFLATNGAPFKGELVVTREGTAQAFSNERFAIAPRTGAVERVEVDARALCAAQLTVDDPVTITASADEVRVVMDGLVWTLRRKGGTA